MDGGDQIYFTVTEHFVLVRKCDMVDMMLNYSLFVLLACLLCFTMDALGGSQ